MKNTILNIDTSSKLEKNGKINSKNSTKTNKETPSLFDNILKQTKNNIKAKQKILSTKPQISNKNRKKDDSLKDKDSKFTQKTTLLDNMINKIKIDKKSTIKSNTLNKDTNQNLKTDDKIGNSKDNTNKNIKSTDNITNKQVSVKDNVSQNIKSDDKIINKIINSKDNTNKNIKSTDNITNKQVSVKDNVSQNIKSDDKINQKELDNKDTNVKDVLIQIKKDSKDRSMKVSVKSELIDKNISEESLKIKNGNSLKNQENKRLELTNINKINVNENSDIEIKKDSILLDDNISNNQNLNDKEPIYKNGETTDIKSDKVVNYTKDIISGEFINITNIGKIKNSKIDTKSNKKDILNQNDNSNNKNNRLLDTLIKDAKKIDNRSTTIVNSDNIKAEQYIINQKSSKNTLSKIKIQQSKEILVSKNTNLKAEVKIEKSANTLELNIDEVKVTQEDNENKILLKKENENLKIKLNQQNNYLNKIFLNKNNGQIITKDIINNKKMELKEVQKEIKVVEKEIEIKVEQTTAQIITNKIVTARQKLQSFMSDIARQMYINYKPPITAFRIKLNPVNLGSIAIVMKSNKIDNTIKVSMNMSQSSTLEVMEQNRSSLQEVLEKTFDDDSSFSMDFNMSDDTNEQHSYQEDGKKQNKTTQTRLSTQEKLDNSNQNYM